MSSYLPCGVYMESYEADQQWWRTRFIKGKMIFMAVVLITLPYLLDTSWLTVLFTDGLSAAAVHVWSNSPQSQWLSVFYTISYYTLAALGVQLLIGYCGQITLGHQAFVAVGGYGTAMMMIFINWPEWMINAGLVYPITAVCAAFLAGLWSVLFGLPSARVKGFYLIMTTLAAQWITVPLVITQFFAKIGERGQAFPIEPKFLKIGPFDIDGDTKIYYLSIILVALCLLAMGNLVRSKYGRAWIAIRDNDIAAETMGVNIVRYKLLAFFVAGFFGGIAGSFYLSALLAISPEHYEWFYSLWWVGIILIGGVGSIQGLVFGAAFWALVQKFLQLGGTWSSDLLMTHFPTIASKVATKIFFFQDVAFGLAIILFLIYEPNGLGYRYWQLKNYFNLWPFSYTGK